MCKLLLPISISEGQQPLQAAMKSQTCPLTPVCPCCILLHACFIPGAFLCLTGTVIWASSPWGPTFLLPSLHPTAWLLSPAPGAAVCVVSTAHSRAVSGHHISPGTLTHCPQVEFPSAFQTDAEPLPSPLSSPPSPGGAGGVKVPSGISITSSSAAPFYAPCKASSTRNLVLPGSPHAPTCRVELGLSLAHVLLLP